MKTARDYEKSIEAAAKKLTDTNRKVYLEEPFSGSFCSLDEPEEELRRDSVLTKFREIKINQDGQFYFVIERLMGRK